MSHPTAPPPPPGAGGFEPPFPPLPPETPPLQKTSPLKKRLISLIRLSFTIALGLVFGLVLFLTWVVFTTDEAERQKLFAPLHETGSIVNSFTGISTPKTILVMGVDLPGVGQNVSFEGVRSDTIMMTRFNPSRKTISVISVPRDSRVQLANGHTDKINAAFAYGGPDMARQTVENNFGVHFDHFIVINTAGVREVVDALGGIDVYVEKPMRYRDYSAKLFVDLQPGLHHMDGAKAEGFLRFRHDPLGDIGRVRRQQVFISAVLKRLKDPSVWLSIPNVIQTGRKYILTDMSNADLIAVATTAKDVQGKGFQVGTLPGGSGMSGGISYWNVDAESAEKMINRMILGIVPSKEVIDPEALPTIGLLYSRNHTEDLDLWEAKIEEKGYKVSCKAIRPRSATQLLVHDFSKTSDDFAKLRDISPAFANLQLIFSPIGSTFESNSCGNTDFTIVLGDNTRSLIQ